MADSTRVGIKGIIARLKAFTNLTNIVSTRIFTNVPQQSTHPHVVIEFTSTDWSQQDDANLQHRITVHSYSRKSSTSEANQIAEEVYAALNRQENNITLDSGSVVLLQFTGVKTTFKEDDGTTWHSITEFNFIID